MDFLHFYLSLLDLWTAAMDMDSALCYATVRPVDLIQHSIGLTCRTDLTKWRQQGGSGTANNSKALTHLLNNTVTT